MLKTYRFNGGLFQFEAGKQPAGAVEVKPKSKARKPANKAKKPANKEAETETEETAETE